MWVTEVEILQITINNSHATIKILPTFRGKKYNSTGKINANKKNIKYGTKMVFVFYNKILKKTFPACKNNVNVIRCTHKMYVSFYKQCESYI